MLTKITASEALDLIVRILLFSIAMTLPATASDNWQLLTQSAGGVVSLVSHLSQSECEHAKSLILGAPSTEKEKEDVQREFERGMAKEWATLAKQKEWQKAHPQCKHVEWWISGGSPYSTRLYSQEDLSGKDGKCSADGRDSFMPLGVDDDLSMLSPDTNPLIEKTQKEAALRKFGFEANAVIQSARCFQ
jgi:hypothetical protein